MVGFLPQGHHNKSCRKILQFQGVPVDQFHQQVGGVERGRAQNGKMPHLLCLPYLDLGPLLHKALG